jgi:hypothetical protein
VVGTDRHDDPLVIAPTTSRGRADASGRLSGRPTPPSRPVPHPVSTRHRQVLHAPADPLAPASEAQFTLLITIEPGRDPRLVVASLLLAWFFVSAAVFHLSFR